MSSAAKISVVVVRLINFAMFNSFPLHDPRYGSAGGGDADATGISLFLVDRSAPGVTLKEYRTIDELRAADVWLSGVSLPAEARLGDEGRALPLIEDAADYATALLCAEAVGAIRFANDAATRFLARAQTDLVGRRCADILRCRDCHGEKLEGPRCFARAVVSGDATLRDVPAEIDVGQQADFLCFLRDCTCLFRTISGKGGNFLFLLLDGCIEEIDNTGMFGHALLKGFRQLGQPPDLPFQI